MMIGWRARLGVMVPSANTTLEPELYTMAPPGVSIHFARMMIFGNPPKSLDRMIQDVPRCARELVNARVDAVAFGCTGGSFYMGAAFNNELTRRIRRIVRVPTVTTATAIVDALKEMNIKKVSVATPYLEWVNRKEKDFLEAQGFEVISIEGLGMSLGMGDVAVEEVYRLARKVSRPEADGMLVSCTDFRTVEILDVLERDLGKPVISSNQATMWSMLKMAKVRTCIEGFGELLTRL